MKKEYVIPMFAILFLDEEEIACDAISSSLEDSNDVIGGDDIGDWD